MARLRDLTGEQVIAILGDFGYHVAAREGEYVKVRKPVARGTSHAITFPRVKDLDRLALAAIFQEARQYVPEERLRRRFYEDLPPFPPREGTGG